MKINVMKIIAFANNFGYEISNLNKVKTIILFFYFLCIKFKKLHVRNIGCNRMKRTFALLWLHVFNAYGQP